MSDKPLIPTHGYHGGPLTCILAMYEDGDEVHVQEAVKALQARCRELEAERDRLQARLDRLADYGLDARDVGDGDANALWHRVDVFRSDPDATLSAEDVRALAEWWADLHTLLSKLDAELVGVQAERERLLRAVIHAKNWFEGSRRENAAEIIRILNEVLAAAEAKL